MELIQFCSNRVHLGDHDLGPLLDGLRTPTDYVLAGEGQSYYLQGMPALFVVHKWKVWRPDEVNVLCSWAEHFTLSMSVSTQVY